MHIIYRRSCRMDSTAGLKFAIGANGMLDFSCELCFKVRIFTPSRWSQAMYNFTTLRVPAAEEPQSMISLRFYTFLQTFSANPSSFLAQLLVHLPASVSLLCLPSLLILSILVTPSTSLRYLIFVACSFFMCLFCIRSVHVSLHTYIPLMSLYLLVTVFINIVFTGSM